MADAKRDGNSVKVILGTLNDGTVTTPVKANSANHALKVSDGTTGSDNGPTIDKRDTNYEPAMIGVSSSNGASLVALYTDSSGNLLIKST